MLLLMQIGTMICCTSITVVDAKILRLSLIPNDRNGVSFFNMTNNLHFVSSFKVSSIRAAQSFTVCSKNQELRSHSFSAPDFSYTGSCCSLFLCLFLSLILWYCQVSVCCTYHCRGLICLRISPR